MRAIHGQLHRPHGKCEWAQCPLVIACKNTGLDLEPISVAGHRGWRGRSQIAAVRHTGVKHHSDIHWSPNEINILLHNQSKYVVLYFLCLKMTVHQNVNVVIIRHHVIPIRLS